MKWLFTLLFFSFLFLRSRGAFGPPVAFKMLLKFYSITALCLFVCFKKKNLNIIFASVQYSLNGYILHIFNTENILIYKIFTTKKFTV